MKAAELLTKILKNANILNLISSLDFSNNDALLSEIDTIYARELKFAKSDLIRRYMDFKQKLSANDLIQEEKLMIEMLNYKECSSLEPIFDHRFIIEEGISELKHLKPVFVYSRSEFEDFYKKRLGQLL